MPRGEPELEPVAETAPLAPETAPVALEAATAAPVAVPYGARGPDGLGGMRDVLALSSAGERRRFVLQLQRTAGNAAVRCSWSTKRGRSPGLESAFTSRMPPRPSGVRAP